MNPGDVVGRVLAALAATPGADGADIVAALIAGGVAEADAWRAWHLVPSAFCRVHFETLGVQFKDELVFVNATNRVTSRQTLSDDAMFSAARDIARATPDRDTVQSVARHGSEFTAIAMALKDGAP